MQTESSTRDSHEATLVFEHVWKYFELHILHRGSMQKFFLVAASIAGYAFVNASTRDAANKNVLCLIASCGAVFSCSFFMLDVITLRKIYNAKAVLISLLRSMPGVDSQPRPNILDILGGTDLRLDEAFPGKGILFRDPFWTTVFEGCLIVAFIMAACWSQSLPLALTLPLVSLAVSGIVAVAYLALRPTLSGSRLPDEVALLIRHEVVGQGNDGARLPAKES